MAITEAAYLRVGLGFVPEQVRNEMKEKREDPTMTWRLPEPDEREELSEHERYAIGLDLVGEDSKAPVHPKTLRFGKSKGTTAGQYSMVKRRKASGVMPKKGTRQATQPQSFGKRRMAELALSALEAYGFVERRTVRMRHLSGGEKAANRREYRKNRSQILRKASTAGAKRKRKIRDMKHDRAFHGKTKSGYRQYTK